MIVFRTLKVVIILLTLFFISMAIYKGTSELPEEAKQPAYYFEIKFYIIISIAGALLLGLMQLFTKKIKVMMD